MSAPGLVLYRCPTRTNHLCPCGAVERRLQKLGLEHETRRVPYRRSARPEVEELTKQRRVPVLVDDDEVIRKVVRTVLEADDFEVVEAKDGAEAIDRVASDQPFTILARGQTV